MAKCGAKCEIYSRIVGYFRPISQWNIGKRQEFNDRKNFIVSTKSNQNKDNNHDGKHE
jgi:ribonucleoside-triphosphate reductase